MLVSLEMARSHVRADGEDDDEWFGFMIPAVSDAVLLWLKDSWRAYELEVDSNGDLVLDENGKPIPLEDSNGPIVRAAVQAAVLIELGMQYRYRDGEGPVHSFGHGYVLCERATNMLNALRRPTLA